MRISNFLRYYQNKRHSIHFIKVLLIVELSLQLFSFSSYVYYRVKTLQIATQDIKQNWFFNKTENQWWFPESKLIYSYINPFVGWLTRPMITDHIHIDTNGTRLTTNSSSSKSAKKIFMLGGSTLWGFNVSDQETIPSYVARELNSVSSDFTVMNYSNPGYNSSQEVNYLIKKLKKGNIPNTVIFYDGCNDLQVKTMYTVPQSVYHEQEIIDNIGNIWNFDRPNLDVNRSIFGIEFISNLHQFAFKYIKLYRYPNKIFNKILKRTAQPEQQIYTHQFNPMDAEYISNLVAEEFLTNVALLDKLAQVFNYTHGEILIVYGAAHMPDIERRFTQQHNYVPHLEHRLVAFSF